MDIFATVMARTFGENLKRIREGKGMSQWAVARAVSYKKQSRISTLENSDVLPNAKTIARFAAALECSSAELLRDVETPYDRLKQGLPLLTPGRTRRARAPAGKRSA